MELPWKPNRKEPYQLQEEREAKKPGARKQPNSGRRWNRRGDVIRGEFLIDTKDCPGGSYRLNEKDWRHLQVIANRTPPGKLPALQIDLAGISITVIPTEAFDEQFR